MSLHNESFQPQGCLTLPHHTEWGHTQCITIRAYLLGECDVPIYLGILMVALKKKIFKCSNYCWIVNCLLIVLKT